MAILLAIIFWYIVQSEQVLEISRKLRVQLIAPEGFVVKGGNIQYKDANLRGPRALLNHYSMEPINTQVRLFTDKPQNVRVRIDKEYIKNWNDRIKITIYDAYISVYLDKKVEKDIKVKENLTGMPKEGHIVEKVVINPESVVISGPATELQRMDTISTEQIDISGLEESKSLETILMVNDSTMKTTPKKVQVNIIIGDKKVNRSFSDIPIQVEGSGAHHPYKIRPSRISVVLQASPEKLNSIKESDLKATLNLNDLGPGIHEQKIQIKIPPDTVLIDTSLENAIIEIYGRKKNL